MDPAHQRISACELVEHEQHHSLRESVYAYMVRTELRLYQKEALEIATVGEHVFENNPVVVALVCFLFLERLRFNLLELCLNIRMIGRKFPENCEVS
jgi:hypothetical protein